MFGGITMSEQVASQSSEDSKQTAIEDFRTALGLTDSEPEAVQTEQVEQSQAGETSEVESEEPEAPAIEQPEPRKIKVKHNKEEVEVDVSDDKLPEYVQKALALDKERERKTQLEKNLERAAKLAGFEKTEDYLSSLDKLEQDAKKREQDKFTDLRRELREEAENNGFDPEKVEAWLDNHPLLKEANVAIQERQRAEVERQQKSARDSEQRRWKQLYDAYPDLMESAKAFREGGMPEWFTQEMQDKVRRGYDPLDAYELANRKSIKESSKEQGRRQAIKEQRLGQRAQVETEAIATLEPEVPSGLAAAFSLFGLPKEAAKKYAKK